MSRQLGRPPRKECGGPDVATRAAEPADTHPTANRRHDAFAAPGPDDRADVELLALAAERGYQMACRCLDCHRWLADPVSVTYHRGPICRKRAGVRS